MFILRTGSRVHIVAEAICVFFKVEIFYMISVNKSFQTELQINGIDCLKML